jgi:hypothetical protein
MGSDGKAIEQLKPWLKYCGAAGKPGGNGENKPRPVAVEDPSLLDNPKNRRQIGVASFSDDNFPGADTHL